MQSTTGCLVLAKSSVQAKKLSKQFAAHEIQRSYLGIVHGSIKKGFVGEVETRLRVDDDCVRKAEGESGMAASTKWQCLSSSGSHSLLHLEPGTGRKHQLRVHCAETLKGPFQFSFRTPEAFRWLTLLLSLAPLVGDFKYGPDAHHRALLGFAPDTILLHSLTTSFWVRLRRLERRLCADSSTACRPGTSRASEARSSRGLSRRLCSRSSAKSLGLN